MDLDIIPSPVDANDERLVFFDTAACRIQRSNTVGAVETKIYCRHRGRQQRYQDNQDSRYASTHVVLHSWSDFRATEIVHRPEATNA